MGESVWRYLGGGGGGINNTSRTRGPIGTDAVGGFCAGIILSNNEDAFPPFLDSSPT